MNSIHQPAVFDRTPTPVGESTSVTQTGKQRIAVIEIDGIMFYSLLPNSAEECDAINAAAAKIVPE